MNDAQKAVRRGMAPQGGNGFGRQIRSYVLAPEARVIDHRTGVKTSDVDAVLDGDLDAFIHAALARANGVKG